MSEYINVSRSKFNELLNKFMNMRKYMGMS
jgi:hypothetical protein